MSTARTYRDIVVETPFGKVRFDIGSDYELSHLNIRFMALPGEGQFLGTIKVDGVDYTCKGLLQLQGEEWVTLRTAKGNESSDGLEVYIWKQSHLTTPKKVRDAVRAAIVNAINAYMKKNPSTYIDAERNRLQLLANRAEQRVETLRKELAMAEENYKAAVAVQQAFGAKHHAFPPGQCRKCGARVSPNDEYCGKGGRLCVNME